MTSEPLRSRRSEGFYQFDDIGQNQNWKKIFTPTSSVEKPLSRHQFLSAPVIAPVRKVEPFFHRMCKSNPSMAKDRIGPLSKWFARRRVSKHPFSPSVALVVLTGSKPLDQLTRFVRLFRGTGTSTSPLPLEAPESPLSPGPVNREHTFSWYIRPRQGSEQVRLLVSTHSSRCRARIVVQDCCLFVSRIRSQRRAAGRD